MSLCFGVLEAVLADCVCHSGPVTLYQSLLKRLRNKNLPTFSKMLKMAQPENRMESCMQLWYNDLRRIPPFP